MAGPKPAWSAALVLLTACAGIGQAAEAPAAVQGFVSDAQGTPVSGAVISVFGGGLRGGLITRSDPQGRFVLTGLPAGSYTLRALGQGQGSAPARAFTVLPEQRAVFSVSLPAPLAEGVQVEGDAPAKTEAQRPREDREAARELRYRLRHKRRSVLETRESDAGQASYASLQAASPREVELAGRLEFVAHTTSAALKALSREDAASYGLLRLDGRLTDSVSWSLGGLVAENDSASWRMATEFLIDTGGVHEITVGSGYGSGVLRPALTDGARTRGSEGRMGALFVSDRVRLGRDWSATLGTRWTYIGFVQDDNHTQPEGSLSFTRGPHRVTASAQARTLIPGGDLLTLASLGTAPALAYAVLDDGLRPERVTRYELAYTADLGALDLGARAFREGARDRLGNLFEPGGGRLRIVNTEGVVATGVALSVARRWGRHMHGSLGYALGHARSSDAPQSTPTVGLLPARSTRARFHDVEARLETALAASGTRLMLYYRLGALDGDDDPAPAVRTRFDVRLNQDLPFLTPLTRADWEVLLAVRNLFYETGEGGLLDELAVQNPPTRVVGGISVRF
jgi:hypothetical protein